MSIINSKMTMKEFSLAENLKNTSLIFTTVLILILIRGALK